MYEFNFLWCTVKVWCGEVKTKGWRRARLVPQLLSGADVLAGKESHAGEAQVLV